MADIAAIENDEAIFVTDERLERIRCETARDVTLQTLMSVIQTGCNSTDPHVCNPDWV